MGFGKMVDMAKTPVEIKEEKAEMAVPAMEGDMPKYPWGLCISLDNESLDKLGADADCEVGDLVHIMAMAKVTSVSQNETTEGTNKRVELQIVQMSVEDESTEGDEEEPVRRTVGAKNLYKK